MFDHPDLEPIRVVWYGLAEEVERMMGWHSIVFSEEPLHHLEWVAGADTPPRQTARESSPLLRSRRGTAACWHESSRQVSKRTTCIRETSQQALSKAMTCSLESSRQVSRRTTCVPDTSQQASRVTACDSEFPWQVSTDMVCLPVCLLGLLQPHTSGPFWPLAACLSLSWPLVSS